MLRYGWSLEREFWRNIKPEVYEASWKRVKFTQDSSDLIPESRGIYLVVIDVKKIITHMPFGSFSSPLYVGHTTKLRQRFKQHTIGNKENNIRRKMVEFNNCMYFYFALFNDYPIDALKNLEQSLIDVFGPPLNSINSISPGVIMKQPVQGRIQKGS